MRTFTRTHARANISTRTFVRMGVFSCTRRPSVVRAAVVALRAAPRRPAGDRARRQLGLAIEALVLRTAALR